MIVVVIKTMDSLLHKIEMAEYVQTGYKKRETSRDEVLSSFKDVVDELKKVATTIGVNEIGKFDQVSEDQIEQLRKLNIRVKLLKADTLKIAQTSESTVSNFLTQCPAG